MLKVMGGWYFEPRGCGDNFGRIVIGDIPRGYKGMSGEILWCQPNGMSIWISVNPICQVCYTDLIKSGFVDGEIVEIEGKKFFCRLLAPAKGPNSSSEWEQVIYASGETPSFLNGDMPCWGSMTIESVNGKTLAETYGGPSVKLVNCLDVNTDMAYFRPVLEPVETGMSVILDDQQFVVRLPYGGAIKETADESEWNRATDMASWAIDPNEFMDNCYSMCYECGQYSDMAVIRDWTPKNKAYFEHNAGDWGPSIGFRPVLVPVKNMQGHLFHDPSIFQGIQGVGIIRMYALLVDGKPVKFGDEPECSQQKKFDSSVSITSEFFGPEYLIPWVVFDGKAIAARNLFAYVSWNKLKELGFCNYV